MANKLNVSVDKENLKIIMTREFDAPRELVWKGFTTKEMIVKWWGFDGSTTVEKLDFVEGGEWRYVDKQGSDQESAFHGKFSNIKEPEQFTWTFNYEPIGPGHEITETYKLEELEGGRTLMTSTSHYNSIEDLEGMAESMEPGASESMDKLEKAVMELNK